MTVRHPAADVAAKLALAGQLSFALADRQLARFSDKAYTDTLGDLSLGLFGSVVAALAVVAWERSARGRLDPDGA